MKVREYILKLLQNKFIKGFYSTTITKNTSATVEEVEKELEKFVSTGVLYKQYEVLCNDCFRVIDKKSNENEFNTYYVCKFCGKENEEDILISVKYIKEAHL